MPGRVAVAIVFAGAVVAVPARAAAPGALGYPGRLLNADGAPSTGIVSLAFSVWDAPSGGTQLWSEGQQIGLTDGFYLR